jgi:hypothetical protein
VTLRNLKIAIDEASIWAAWNSWTSFDLTKLVTKIEIETAVFSGMKAGSWDLVMQQKGVKINLDTAHNLANTYLVETAKALEESNDVRQVSNHLTSGLMRAGIMVNSAQVTANITGFGQWSANVGRFEATTSAAALMGKKVDILGTLFRGKISVTQDSLSDRAFDLRELVMDINASGTGKLEMACTVSPEIAEKVSSGIGAFAIRALVNPKDPIKVIVPMERHDVVLNRVQVLMDNHWILERILMFFMSRLKQEQGSLKLMMFNLWKNPALKGGAPNQDTKLDIRNMLQNLFPEKKQALPQGAAPGGGQFAPVPAAITSAEGQLTFEQEWELVEANEAITEDETARGGSVPAQGGESTKTWRVMQPTSQSSSRPAPKIRMGGHRAPKKK